MKEKGGNWVELNDESTRKKVAQALRDTGADDGGHKQSDAMENELNLCSDVVTDGWNKETCTFDEHHPRSGKSNAYVTETHKRRLFHSMRNETSCLPTRACLSSDFQRYSSKMKQQQHVA